jgi:hypothetical protein
MYLGSDAHQHSGADPRHRHMLAPQVVHHDVHTAGMSILVFR